MINSKFMPNVANLLNSGRLATLITKAYLIINYLQSEVSLIQLEFAD